MPVDFGLSFDREQRPVAFWALMVCHLVVGVAIAVGGTIGLIVGWAGR